MDAVFIAIWLIFILNIGFSQMRFHRAYRDVVDPSFPASPAQLSESSYSRLGLIRKQIQIAFTKYPDYPQVDRLARRARYEIIATPFVMVGMLVMFILLNKYV